MQSQDSMSSLDLETQLSREKENTSEEEKEVIQEPENQEKQKIAYQEQTQQFQKPRLYSYRWIILVLYLLGDLIPSVIVTTTTPIASQISQIYALQPIEVNLSTLVILIVAPFSTVLSSKFLDENGLSLSIRVGTLICIGGAWLRVLVSYNFYFVVAGNFLTGIGAPFIFNGKTQVASNWFSHEQGPGVTSFISFWVNLNSIGGFVFAGNYLGDYKFDINQVEEGRRLVWELMFFIALGVSGIGVIIWIFFKQNPPTPPSFTAQIEREHNFKESVKKLLKNRNYIFLILQQGLFLGSMSGLSTAISYFILPFGFDSQDSTVMLGAIPVGGVIGTIISSYFLNKYKQYKFQMGICSLGGGGALFLFMLMLYTESIYLCAIGSGIIGLFFLPMIPTLLEFACESVFPIGEGSTVGFLSGVSNLFALVYGSVMSFVVKGESKGESFVGIMIMMSSFGLGFLLLFLTTENLVRHKTEQMRQSMFSNNQGDIQLTDMTSITQTLQIKRSSVDDSNNDNIKNETEPTCKYESPDKNIRNQEELKNETITDNKNINRDVQSISQQQSSQLIASQKESIQESEKEMVKQSNEIFSSVSSSDYSTGSSGKGAEIVSIHSLKGTSKDNIAQFSSTPAAIINKGEQNYQQEQQGISHFNSTPGSVQRKQSSISKEQQNCNNTKEQQIIENQEEEEEQEEQYYDQIQSIQIGSPHDAISHRLNR